MINLKDIIVEGLNILLSTIGLPSMLAILGGALATFGVVEHQPIAFFGGLLWIATDYLIYGKEIYDFVEDIGGYF